MLKDWKPIEWTRSPGNPVLRPLKEGTIDRPRLMNPFCVRVGDQYRLYYTGNDGSDTGLQAFCGIGLATSEDGLHWERFSAEPVIRGDVYPEFPDNRGIAGGGSILEDRLEDGSVRYRMYYSLVVGTKSEDIFIDQEKHCAVCHSSDGKAQLALGPDSEHPWEQKMVEYPNVLQEGEGLRLFYCGNDFGGTGIGTAVGD